MSIRIGQGVDVHAFDRNCVEKASSIFLGGVNIPSRYPLIAHSDGDVLLHALSDALLGSLSLGDIGKHFPDTDQKWCGADSRQLLKACYELVKNKGWYLVNADVTVMAQQPKLAPYIESICTTISTDLAVAIDQISVKATTTEKLGYVGRSEGICVSAVVLIQQAVT